MNNLLNIVKFEIIDNIKSKWFFIYFFTNFIFIYLVLYFSTGKPSEIIATITNFFLLVLPIFTMLLGIINFYESINFQILILIRGVSRTTIFIGKYLGILLNLILSFILGFISIYLFYNKINNFIYIFLLLSFYSILLHFVFLSISFFISQFLTRLEIRIALAILIWFFLYILYDSLIFFITLEFGDYPIEPIILVMVLLNPLDLTRTILLLHGELSAIMSYSSALYMDKLGTFWGILIGIGILLLWSISFFIFSLKKFKTKDI